MNIGTTDIGTMDIVIYQETEHHWAWFQRHLSTFGYIVAYFDPSIESSNPVGQESLEMASGSLEKCSRVP